MLDRDERNVAQRSLQFASDSMESSTVESIEYRNMQISIIIEVVTRHSQMAGR